jgi:NADH-quinone oxidoreductase subunit E/NADP-reducing hydrogenase subunit HndA
MNVPSAAAPIADAEGFYGTAEPLSASEIDPAAIAIIDDFVASHPGGPERLIPLLHRLQEEVGCVPHPVQARVAERLGLSPVEVFSVQSFYHFFTLTPRGRFPLKVCMGTACFVRHAEGLIQTIEDTLGVHVGESTADGLFSLERVRCLGACGLAPAVMVGQDVHGNLDPKQMRRLITHLRARGRREQAAAGEPRHA